FMHHVTPPTPLYPLSVHDALPISGTFHPATTLRALGPDPWNAAFVQPCRRPTDGRYGENPNRLQHYYQYQVVLKPSPPDLQELRSEEHTSELQSRENLVCRLLLEK